MIHLPTKSPGLTMARVANLFKNAATEWSKDKCPQLGAALAYYAVFSLAPLLLVLLGIFGFIYNGNQPAREKILEQLGNFLDPSGMKAVTDIANTAAQPKNSILATAFGIIVALFGASGIFGQLQDALNTILITKRQPGRGIWHFVQARLLPFAMVGGICLLLLLSLATQGTLKALHGYLEAAFPGGHFLSLALFYLFDLVMMVLLVGMLFRYLPEVRIAWRHLWVGSVLTAVLFIIGKFLLGLDLGTGAAGSAYGAAGSLITLLAWIFYTAQIRLFGAEFTKVYANRHTLQAEPDRGGAAVEKKEIENQNSKNQAAGIIRTELR
jgi:membrane protein